MPSSTLQIYRNLDTFTDDQEYWKNYTDFYERFWGGPTSPYGFWYGSEYEAFQEAVCDYMEIERNQIKECLFIKENSEYFICPTISKKNEPPFAFLVDNIIPIHWFFIFKEKQKKIFKTHWGFGAIHYKSKIEDINKLINHFTNIESSNKEQKDNLDNYLEIIKNDLKELRKWLSSFPKDSLVVLNYGDLLSSLPMSSLDKEDSVKIATDFTNSLAQDNLIKANELIEFLINRWTQIEFANQKNLSPSSN